MPDGYTLEEIEVDGIAMEWVQAKGEKPDKAVLQLHGGAYNRSLAVNGTTYRRAAVKYAEISGAGVLTVDYRVAPEHPYPAALEDALFAYNWLLDQGYEPEDIIVAGDSAGGGLTLATALYLRDHDNAGGADHHVGVDGSGLQALGAALCGRRPRGQSVHFARLWRI